MSISLQARPIRVDASRGVQYILLAVLVIGIGLGFSAFGLPAGWLIAAVIGAAITALTSGREINPPATAMVAAQGIVGVMAVEPLTKLTKSDLVHFTGCAVFSVGVTLGLSIAFGVLLVRFADKIDMATATLSLIAGGAVTISCMARDLGADERYVALSQYLRLTIVVLTMPLVLMQMGIAGPTAKVVAVHDVWHWKGLIALAVVVYLGRRLARWARVPAANLLGPLMLAAAVELAFPSVAAMMDPNTVVATVAYVVIGWQAGGGFAVDVLRRFVKLIPVMLTFIALTLAGCFAVAVAVSHWASVPLTDAYLATTPGGIFGVLAVANAVGSGPIVVTLQVLRILTLVVAAGMLPKIIGRLEAKLAG
jgi:uncharacterized protein